MNIIRIWEKFINGIYSSVLSSEAGSPPITSLYFAYDVCRVSSCIR